MSIINSSMLGEIAYTICRPIPLDSWTHSLLTINGNEIAINKEHHFFLKTYLSFSENEETQRMMFIVPSLPTRVHAFVILWSDSDVIMSIYEGITTSNNGTPITCFNNDRNSLNTPELIAYAEPTVTNEGTLLWDTRTGGGKDSIGITAHLNYKIVVKSEAKYLFKIVNKTNNNCYVNTDFFWWEDVPKN